MLTNSSLHHFIIEYFIEKGCAPALNEISQGLQYPITEVKDALQSLQSDHGIVLHPNSSRIWVVHPFSTAPTLFLVESNYRRWWGNCAWCSLGIAALVEQPVVIRTTSGGEGDPLQIAIVNEEVDKPDHVVHFPVPMQQAWDNVIYTCSTMLLFRDEEEVKGWCQRHNIAKGDVQPLYRIWPFARDWYGRHRHPDWRKWTVKEALAIFRRHGLTHTIWQVDDSSNRF